MQVFRCTRVLLVAACLLVCVAAWLLDYLAGLARLRLGYIFLWLGLAWLGLLGLAWLGLAWLGLPWLGLAWLDLPWLVGNSLNAQGTQGIWGCYEANVMEGLEGPLQETLISRS